MIQPPRFVLGTSQLFTATYSSTPEGPPLLEVWNNSGTLVGSLPMSGAAGSWYAFWTIPGTANVLYAYTVTASYVAGPDKQAGQFFGQSFLPW